MKRTSDQIKEEINQLIKKREELHSNFENELLSIFEKLQEKDSISTQAYVNLQRRKVALIAQYEQDLVEIITQLKAKKSEYCEEKLKESLAKIERRKNK